MQRAFGAAECARPRAQQWSSASRAKNSRDVSLLGFAAPEDERTPTVMIKLRFGAYSGQRVFLTVPDGKLTVTAAMVVVAQW